MTTMQHHLHHQTKRETVTRTITQEQAKILAEQNIIQRIGSTPQNVYYQTNRTRKLTTKQLDKLLEQITQ